MKITIGAGLLLSVAFFSCSKSKNTQTAPRFTALGSVTSVCHGASPSGPGRVPYVITFSDATDSILVTNLPGGYGVNPDLQLKVTYEENDTLPMIRTQDRIYPRRATIVKVEKK